MTFGVVSGPVVRTWINASTAMEDAATLDDDGEGLAEGMEEAEGDDPGYVLNPDRSHNTDATTARFHHSLLVPEARQDRHLLGLLAKVEADKHVFGVTTLVGRGHNGLAHRIYHAFNGIGSILWGGELVLRGRAEGPLLTGIINRSGFVSGNPPGHRKTDLSLPHVQNSNDALLMALRGSPSLLAVDKLVRVVDFKHGRGTQHLNAILNDRGLDLHSIGNQITICVALLSDIGGAYSKEEAFNYLKGNFRASTVETRDFCELLQSLGLCNGWAHTLLQGLNRILDGADIAEDNMSGFLAAANQLQEYYTGISTDNGTQYDLYVL